MKTDILNRTEFVDRIVDFINTLSDSKRGTCFAIDGKWGSGKTFVLELLEEKIKELQSEETGYDKCFLVHYNCWKYDYYDEPAVAMVSAMLDAIDTEESFLSPELDGTAKAAWDIVKEEIKNIAGKFVENHIGVNIVDVYERIKSGVEASTEERNAFDATFAFKRTLDEARESLKKIAEQKTVVFVVDEMDRCMPVYAIKTLERLHHFFDGIDNIIVVVAVDSKQLSHSIKEIYGQDTEEKEYLKKFIKLAFKLDAGDLEGDIFEKYPHYFSMFDISEDTKPIVTDIFNTIWHGIDIRTQETVVEKAAVIHNYIIGKNQKVALALFEMFTLRFDNVICGDLSWITNINKVSYSDIEKDMDPVVLASLKALEEVASTGYYIEYNGRRYEWADSIVGQIYYLISEYNKSHIEYYIKGAERYADMRDAAGRFLELMEIIE